MAPNFVAVQEDDCCMVDCIKVEQNMVPVSSPVGGQGEVPGVLHLDVVHIMVGHTCSHADPTLGCTTPGIQRSWLRVPEGKIPISSHSRKKGSASIAPLTLPASSMNKQPFKVEKFESKPR